MYMGWFNPLTRGEVVRCGAGALKKHPPGPELAFPVINARRLFLREVLCQVHYLAAVGTAFQQRIAAVDAGGGLRSRRSGPPLNRVMAGKPPPLHPKAPFRPERGQ